MRSNIERSSPVGQDITLVWTEFINVCKLTRGSSLEILLATEASVPT